MTDTTPKGIPFPENGIDYLIDAALQIQAVAEKVDELLDGYRLLSINGLTSVVNTLDADTLPIGTTEAVVLASDSFELSEETQVQLTLSWGSLSATEISTAQIRLRPGSLGGTPVGGAQVLLSGIGSQGGGSITACPTLPAGTYTILATLQLDTGETVLNASVESPATLLVRPLP